MGRQMGLRLHREPLIVDNFAGGGGASLGLEWALGRSPDIAVNHDPEAIAMHAENHPATRHLCESVWDVDPIEVCGGRPVALAWFSPDCTHFSKAKGGKPVKKEIRGLAWVVNRWARAVRPRVIILENVEEFQTWGPLLDDGRPDPARRGETFAEWKADLESIDYVCEFRTLRGCDYGAPTTRERLFGVLRCDGLPAVWPEPTHGPGREFPHRVAAECIDFSVPAPSIFLTASEAKGLGLNVRRPLADKTLRRIARGVFKYAINAADPFIVPVTHGGDDRVHSIREPMRTITAAHRGEHAIAIPSIVRTSYGDVDRNGKRRGRGEHDIGAPLPTVTASSGGGGFGLIAPTLVQTGYGERPGQAPRLPQIDKPLGTIVGCGGRHALATAFLAKHNGGNEATGQELAEPVHTVTARDQKALVTSSLLKYYGTSTGSEMHEPMPTIAARGWKLAEVRAFLVKYYGTGVAANLNEPLDTLTAKARFGLVTVAGEDYQIIDIGMRMLIARELYRAQGFPDSYRIDVTHNGGVLTATAQLRMVGNSVCPQLAEALARANVLEMGLMQEAA